MTCAMFGCACQILMDSAGVLPVPPTAPITGLSSFSDWLNVNLLLATRKRTNMKIGKLVTADTNLFVIDNSLFCKIHCICAIPFLNQGGMTKETHCCVEVEMHRDETWPGFFCSPWISFAPVQEAPELSCDRERTF